MTMIKVQHPVQKSINHLFDEMLNEWPRFGRTVNQLFTPPVNIVETPEAYHLELIAPGRSKEDFKITVADGLLTVSAEKQETPAENGLKVVRREFAYQAFKRSFHVDELVQTDNIQAKYENGLLKLLLPRKEALKPETKSITVQ